MVKCICGNAIFETFEHFNNCPSYMPWGDVKEVPCVPCNGYGYFGHTNPNLGDQCSECKGVGLVSEDHIYQDPLTGD